MASRHDEGEKFLPETDLFMPGLQFHRVGNLYFVEGGRKVCFCLFFWDKKKKKKKKKRKIFPPGAEQFPKHIWSVFLKWLSSNLCACVRMCVCVCVCHSYILLMMLSLLLASWMRTRVSPGKRRRRYISSCVRRTRACTQTHTDTHTHTHTHTLILQPPSPSSLLPCVALVGCLGSSRNRECVTKHILSDSHAIFPWSRPRLPFMLRLPVILRRRLL